MIISVTPGSQVRAGIACCVLALSSAANPGHSAEPRTYAAAPPSPHAGNARAALDGLVAEALRNNPEIRAARHEREAAAQRVAPAGALDDPMLEAGVLNLPTNSPGFSREDMTMKMLGVSQRLPYPGKRALKRELAQKDAESVAYAYQETLNRVVRDVKVAYYDLALVHESGRTLEHHRALLEQMLKLAEGRYSVGQGNQVDVLRAQTALSKTIEESLRLDREQPTLEAELNRLLGRPGSAQPIVPAELDLKPVSIDLQSLLARAIATRPQLLALQTISQRSQQAIELAQKDRYPDFDVRFSYGQRDNMRDGTRRSDLVSLTVAINLPVWRQTKITPRVSEAQAAYEQSSGLYEAQKNETSAKLRQQVAIAEQSLRAASLYRNELVPQSRLTVEASLAAYQVNRLEFTPLLDNQMTIFNFEIARLAAVAAYNKALAEIDFLAGAAPPERTH